MATRSGDGWGETGASGFSGLRGGSWPLAAGNLVRVCQLLAECGSRETKILNRIAIYLTTLYQRFVSPYKGFRCAAGRGPATSCRSVGRFDLSVRAGRRSGMGLIILANFGFRNPKARGFYGEKGRRRAGIAPFVFSAILLRRMVSFLCGS